MIRAEFSEELTRLCNGFRQEMTPERAEAIWQLVEHRSLPAWRAAVDRALIDPRFPTGDRLLKFVEESADADRQAYSGRSHSTSQPIPGPRDPIYGQFRYDLMREVVEKKLTPTAVAEKLRAASGFFAAHANAMLIEADEYDRASAEVAGTGRSAWEAVHLSATEVLSND